MFTCLNSQAVHLELASSLQTDCFIDILRRFISRRGTHKTIHSDNGNNFIWAAREVKEAIDELNKKHIQEGCQWLFHHLPKASHASAVWERLIRSTQTALRAIHWKQVKL